MQKSAREIPEIAEVVLVPIVSVAAVVLPLERLKIRKVVGPAFFDRIYITDFPTEVGQRFAVSAVLHPGAERVTAIEIAVVSLGDFAFGPDAQLQLFVG